MTIKTFDSNHLSAPFTYSVDHVDEGKTTQLEKKLSTWQKIIAIAVFILFSPLLIVGGYVAFLAITAHFKNKNIEDWTNNPMPVDEKIKTKLPPPLGGNKTPQDDLPVEEVKKSLLEEQQNEKFNAKIPFCLGGNKEPQKDLPSDEKKSPADQPLNKKIQLAVLEEIPCKIKSLLGSKISYKIAADVIDIDDKNFKLDERILILRSDGLYQYALFKGEVASNNGQFDAGDGQLLQKPLTSFFKLKNLEIPKRIVTEEPISLVVEDEVFQEEDFLRTVQMKTALTHFPNYEPATNTLLINRKNYVAVTTRTRNFFTEPSASCGSNINREVLLLDPENSPVLHKHFEKVLRIISQIPGCMQEDMIFKTVVNYVRDKIFPSHSHHDLLPRLLFFVEAKKALHTTPKINVLGTEIACIPIDAFISKGLGVCRHHALVIAYILDGLKKHLAEKHNFTGTVQIIRDDVIGGAHAWVTYVNKEKKMHIDSLWNVITDFSNARGRKTLEEAYGKEAIERQFKKVGHR